MKALAMAIVLGLLSLLLGGLGHYYFGEYGALVGILVPPIAIVLLFFISEIIKEFTEFIIDEDVPDDRQRPDGSTEQDR